MRLPTQGKNSRYTAVVPRLNGGLDRHSGVAHVADNALWEGENVWWQQGALRPRPGFWFSDADAVFLGESPQMECYEEGNHNPLLVVHTDDKVVVIRQHPKTGAEVRSTLTTITDFTEVFCVPAAGRLAEEFSLLLFAKGRVWGASLHDGGMRELDEWYVPLALINGTPLPQKKGEHTGTFYEGANRLTPWFRCEYRTDGAGTYFRLPFAPLTGEVTVAWQSPWGLYENVIAADQTSASYDNKFQVNVDRETGWFWFNEWGSGPEAMRASDGCNVWVTACRAVEPAEREDVFSAGSACWFGGKRGNAAGGTRLFLAKGSRLMWSALENPLYFPLENTATVGTPNQEITALHRQGERLVIFKERELYSAEYEAATDENRPTHTAVFPLTPLDGQIGCDLPHTVALKGNRLVWACSNGVVYTLSAFGSLTQPSVTELSLPIQPLLQQGGTPQNASAVVEKGVYWLRWNEQLFVLEEGASPVWYRFTLPDTGLAYWRLFSLAGTWRFPAIRGESLFWIRLQGEEDCHVEGEEGKWVFSHRPISTAFCTKSYDMGEPETYKQVLEVSAEVTAASAVHFTCLTERGEADEVTVQPASAGLVRFSPAVWRCRRLAVRVTGDNVCVNSLSIRLRGGMT